MKTKKADKNIATQRASTIAPPEPDLTPAEMLRRAEAMRPMLRAGQAATEAAGRINEETNQAFIDAGFYRLIQPRKFGGYEFDVPTFMRVMMEVARGCPESGWVLCLTAGHAHLMASFPEQGQIETFGDKGEFRTPGVLTPTGKAAPVKGGFRIKGGWDYSSGCDVATHFIGAALIVDQDDKPNGSILFIVDRQDYSIIDNWQMIGMQGTGSRRVVIDDVFVADYRTLPWTTKEGMLANQRPGKSAHKNPMYFGRTTPFLVAESGSVAVGTARGALDLYEEILRSRRSPFPPFPYRYELAEYQHNFGRAQTLIDTATAALLRTGEDYMDYARREAEEGIPFDNELERRMQMVEQQCIHLAWEAVDILFRTAGTSSAKKGADLGRHWRNLGVIRGHLAHQSDTSATNYGRVHFGLPPMGRI